MVAYLYPKPVRTQLFFDDFFSTFVNRFPVRYDDSMNTVLTQELVRFNNLVDTVSTTLRNVLLALPREAYEGMVSATESYALLQARAIRDNFHADWGIAETGASGGGSVHPLGVESGRSCAAVAGPGSERTRITETASGRRVDNMAAFTLAALELLADTLSD